MGIPGLSNQNNGQQRLGITEPISLAGPTEDDVIKTRELEKVLFALILNSCIEVFECYFMLNMNLGVQYLQGVGLYESQEEAVGREEVLGRLDQVEFVCG